MKSERLIRPVRFCIHKLFSFFEKPGSVRPLVFFRISLALICILKFVLIWPYLLDIYGQYGYVQWAITRVGLYDWLPHLGDFMPLAGRLGITADQLVHISVWTFIVSCIFLMMGFLTRLASILCFALHLILIHTGGGFIYGLDVFTQIGLFYCMFMPLGRFLSVDIAIGLARPKTYSQAAGMTRTILQVHLCIIYCSTGLEKLMGHQWLEGEAIWRSVMMPAFNQFELGWMSSVPFISKITTWIVLFFETFYIVLMWIPRVRAVGLFVIVMMHLFIGLFLGMWLFGLIMIILSVTAFGPEVLRDLFPQGIRKIPGTP